MALTLEQRIATLFSPFGRRVVTIRAPGTLADKLEARLKASRNRTFTCGPDVSALYATAAVEVWQRAVHSFLISAAATAVSPIWSSVAGYYASHYCIRAFAHVSGYFHSYRRKKLLRLDLSGAYTCHVEETSREHQIYWKVVKAEPSFAADPLFTENTEVQRSDAAHRSKANYLDHIDNFPNFRPLDEFALKQRIKQLSEMELNAFPEIDAANYPDTDSVQIVAYHRIVRFRKLLDQVLGTRIRFWNQERKPDWCSSFLDFQLTEPQPLLAPSP